MELKHKIKLKILCSLVTLMTIYLPTINAEKIDENDSIIIEAEPNEELDRTSRQLILRGPSYQPDNRQFIIPPGINTIPLTGHCFTTKGVLGKCTSLRHCYPYFKIPELNNYENWLMGMYDTCSYYTEQGRQMFGICCTTPTSIYDDLTTSSTTTPSSSVVTSVDDSQSANEQVLNVTGDNNLMIAYYPQISNWPPPIPTHPPDHTIPPLPTHPSPAGFPTTTKPTAWPPTAAKPPKPPIYTTRPPIHATKPPLFTTRPTIRTTTTVRPVSNPIAACGAKNGYQDQERIVGGHNADVGEWPWIAALFNAGRQFCGGSLIDNIHILSAAHCVAHMSSWDVAKLTVRLGDHNIKTNHEVRHIEKRVKRIVRHRGFDARTLYHDIAILTLDSPVQFSQQIRPICLPSASADFAGQTGTVIGWGSLRESGPQPAVLQEVNIPIWNNLDCMQKYGPAAPGGIVEHMLCAGQAARDSCSGDSGGPLMVNAGKWTQVGIVSWGIGCGKGQYPGVYTRVEKFLPWINKNLK